MMRPRSGRCWLLACLLQVIPVSLSAQGTSVFEFHEELWVIQGVEIPAVSDTFAILQISTWPQRELGFAAKYQTPLTRRVSLDLYVYPVPDTLSQVSGEQAAKVEFEKAVGQLRAYTETNREGVQVTIEVEKAIRVELSEGESPAGWVAEGTFHRSDRNDPTLLFVFSWDGLFVKARVSYHPEDEAKLKPHLDAWLKTNLQRIRRVE